MQELITRAKELLADGTVSRVLGWKKGDLGWDPEPAWFEKEEDLEGFVYNPFCEPKQISHSRRETGREDFGIFKALRYLQL